MQNIIKLLIYVLVLMTVTCSIVSLSAQDDVVVTNKTIENGSLTLGGLQFKIPTGFIEVDSDQDYSTEGDIEYIDGTLVDMEVSADFVNNGQKLDINVGLKNNDVIDTINLPHAQKKTIAGKKGFFWTEIDDGVTEYKFEYIQDGKIVKIEASSEDLIHQVI